MIKYIPLLAAINAQNLTLQNLSNVENLTTTEILPTSDAPTTIQNTTISTTTTTTATLYPIPDNPLLAYLYEIGYHLNSTVDFPWMESIASDYLTCASEKYCDFCKCKKVDALTTSNKTTNYWQAVLSLLNTENEWNKLISNGSCRKGCFDYVTNHLNEDLCFLVKHLGDCLPFRFSARLSFEISTVLTSELPNTNGTLLDDEIRYIILRSSRDNQWATMIYIFVDLLLSMDNETDSPLYKNIYEVSQNFEMNINTGDAVGAVNALLFLDKKSLSLPVSTRNDSRAKRSTGTREDTLYNRILTDIFEIDDYFLYTYYSAAWKIEFQTEFYRIINNCDVDCPDASICTTEYAPQNNSSEFKSFCELRNCNQDFSRFFPNWSLSVKIK